MSDTPTPPTQKHYVLVMTAAVIACDAAGEPDAAMQALAAAPEVLDPKSLAWVVKYVSTKPIYLGDPEDEAPEDTPTPKIEIVR